MNFDDIPVEHHLRVKELVLILQSASLGSKNDIKDSTTIALAEALKWIEELQDLVGIEQCKNFALESCFQRLQPLLALSWQANKGLDILDSTNLLQAIEEYRSSPDPLQWSNFNGQYYSSYHLATKIELLYKIGSFAKILAFNEDFTSYTRVTHNVQNICNCVCQWVEDNLWLKMPPVNIYGPFIWDYQKHPYLRGINLREIGLRSGLIAGDPNDNDYKLSAREAQLIIDWVQENYGIDLPFPATHQLRTELIHNRIPQSFFNTPITIAVLLVLAFASAFTMFYQIYRQSYKQVLEQPTPTMEKTLLKLAVAKKESARKVALPRPLHSP